MVWGIGNVVRICALAVKSYAVHSWSPVKICTVLPNQAVLANMLSIESMWVRIKTSLSSLQFLVSFGGNDCQLKIFQIVTV